MAKSKIDIFFCTADDFEAHIEIIPDESESGFNLLQATSKKLKEAGCKPRPQKSFTSKKPQEPIADKCPQCGQKIDAKPWRTQDGKDLLIYRCTVNDAHYKQYRPKTA